VRLCLQEDTISISRSSAWRISPPTDSRAAKPHLGPLAGWRMIVFKCSRAARRGSPSRSRRSRFAAPGRGRREGVQLLDRVRLGRVGTDMQDPCRMPFGEASSRSSRKTSFCVRVAGCPLVDARRNVIISRYVFTTTALRALSQVAAETRHRWQDLRRDHAAGRRIDLLLNSSRRWLDRHLTPP
jgi:hypothetical protein